jgi:hypothetical protein
MWKYQFLWELVPIAEPRGALWLGHGVHYGLAEFYRSKRDPVEAAYEWLDKKVTPDELSIMWPEEREEFNGVVALLEAMLSGYVAFARENDAFAVMGVEVPLDIHVEGTRSRLIGNIDIVVEQRKGIWVVDHKSTIQYANPVYLELDDQMTAYLWLLEQLTGVFPKGAIYNQLRKKIPAEPEVLVTGGLSKKKNIDTTYEKYLEAIVKHNLNPNHYEDILEFLRNKTEGFYKREYVARSRYELEHFGEQLTAEVREMNSKQTVLYHHPTRDCSWSCSYRDLCLCENTGGDLQALIKVNYEHADEGRREL